MSINAAGENVLNRLENDAEYRKLEIAYWLIRSAQDKRMGLKSKKPITEEVRPYLRGAFGGRAPRRKEVEEVAEMNLGYLIGHELKINC